MSKKAEKSEKENYEAEAKKISDEMAKAESPAQEKALSIRPTAELDLSAAYNPEDWGQAELSSKDIIIPRILLMQPMSPQVTDGKAAFGEWRESLNNELLGKMEDGFEVVPFYMEKVFIEYAITKVAGGKEERKYRASIPITPANEALPYEGEVLDEATGEMIPVSRDRTMNFYVLLKKELEAGSAIPYIISFRKTSLQAGKKLTTQMFMKNINAGKTPASVTVKVIAKKQTGVVNGTNVTYAIADIVPTEPTPTAMVSEAFRWLSMVRQGKTKAHEESLNNERSEDEIIVGEAKGGTGKF
jgi:hypothetical protein